MQIYNLFSIGYITQDQKSHPPRSLEALDTEIKWSHKCSRLKSVLLPVAGLGGGKLQKDAKSSGDDRVPLKPVNGMRVDRFADLFEAGAILALVEAINLAIQEARKTSLDS